ncbi:MAG: glycosyltransferase [Thermoplasmata archaeon]|nr:glycosyltransferase [Thermoplasmata archaeon]
MRTGMFTDSYYPTVDGVVTTINQYKARLNKRGHEVYVFAPGDNELVRTQPDPNVTYVKSVKFFAYGEYRMAFPLAHLNKKVQELGIDVIHSQGAGFVGVKAVWAAYKLKYPLIYSFHTMVTNVMHYVSSIKSIQKVTERLVYEYLRWYFHRCEVVTVPSKTTGQELKEKWPNDVKRFFILSNGIDLNRFNPKVDGTEIRNKWGLEDNKIILHLGRIAPEKNLDTFIKAAPLVKSKYPDCKFIIVGIGPAKEYYENMVKNLKLSNEFIFTGFVPDELIPKYYACADAFTTSSTFETQGIVILEAMASGLPVSGANYRAIPELVKDGENGYLFDAFDPKDCAKAIIKTLEADNQLRQNAFATVEKHSIEKVIDELVELYEEMADLRKKRH